MEELNKFGYICTTSYRILWGYRLIIMKGEMWTNNPDFKF